MTRAIDTLADSIRRSRIALKISLRDLARRAGVSASYLSDIENATRIPSHTIAERIERELHTTGIVDQARSAVIERWYAR